MIDVEQMERDKAAMLPEVRATLRRLVAGDAPSANLRVMALRMLRGDDIRNMALRDVHPTAREVEEINHAHDRAKRR